MFNYNELSILINLVDSETSKMGGVGSPNARIEGRSLIDLLPKLVYLKIRLQYDIPGLDGLTFDQFKKLVLSDWQGLFPITGFIFYRDEGWVRFFSSSGKVILESRVDGLEPG